MANQEDRAVVLPNPGFQPFGCLKVQVVGRLVENQEVRLLQQEPSNCEAGLFATAQGRSRFREVGVFEAHLLQHHLEVTLGAKALGFQEVFVEEREFV